MAKKKTIEQEQHTYAVLMKNTITQWYTVQAATEEEARGKADKFQDMEYSHDSEMTDWELVEIELDD